MNAPQPDPDEQEWPVILIALMLLGWFQFAPALLSAAIWFCLFKTQ